MILNEHDKHAAQWLRNLIAAGHLPPGEVDERDIQELKADDLRSHKHVHLFAGIGGWPLALRFAGWPDDRPVWTGSCPCQPFSSAGKREGTGDERHLWPDMFRLIRECRPGVIFGEQVASAIGHGWLDGVFADLEGEGYACGAVVLGAHSVGAPHIRQRLYWVADARRPGDERELRHRQAHGAAGAVEGQAQQRERSGVDAGGCISALRLEHPQGDGRQQRRAEPDGRGVAGGCGVDGLGDTDGRGCEVLEEQHGDPTSTPANWGPCGQHAHGPCGHGYWRDSRIIACRDGKHRRIPIEPAFFPLVDGLSRGGVGLLRGAGNAIVPQVAAEFVRVYMEAL